MKLRELIVASFFAAILYLQQVVLSGLPNIHLCAVLIILYAVYFPRLVLPSVFVFVLLEGVTYGFGIWWINYLYIWPLLAVICLLFRKNRSVLFWTVLGGFYGLGYGALCSLPYFFIGGPSLALSYWLSGIPFDVVHCIGNSCVILLFWKPLGKLFSRLQSYVCRG